MPKSPPWVLFVIYTFVLTWVVGIALAFPLTAIERQSGLPEDSIASLAAKYGPTFAGFLVAGMLYGKQGLIDLLRKGTRWKASLGCYAFILTIPFVSKLHILWQADQPIAFHTPTFDIGVSIAFAFLLHLFLGGGFGEEFGWRGFMLSEMIGRYRLISAAIIIGFFWGIWHLPAYVLGNRGDSQPLAAFLIAVPALSVIMSWLYVRTNESVLLMAVLHALINASGKIIAAATTVDVSEMQNGTFFWGETIWFVGIAVCLVLFDRKTWFSKEEPTGSPDVNRPAET